MEPQYDENRSADIDSTGRFTRTAVLRKEFGHAWEMWVWVRHQFTPSSVGVIITILGIAATYIIHLNDRVGRQQTHITVLETQVVPLLRQNDKVVDMLSSIGVVAQRLTNLDARLERMDTVRDQLVQGMSKIDDLEYRVRRLESQQEQAISEARKPGRRSHK